MMNPAIEQTLKTWHGMVAAGDLRGVIDITHPDAVFRSPVAHTPYQSAQALSLALNTVSQVFENFTYHREFIDAEGSSAVLEFSATVAGKQLKGIDMIRFADDGRILEFEVMIRPLSGLQALGEEMSRRLGGKLPAIKAG